MSQTDCQHLSAKNFQGPRLAHEAVQGPLDARQRVPTGPNVVGTRCRASEATVKTAVFYRQPRRARLTSPAWTPAHQQKVFWNAPAPPKKSSWLILVFWATRFILCRRCGKSRDIIREAELHTLSAAVGAGLLELAPCVDRARAFPLTPKSPAWWRHWSIIAGAAPRTF